jgi:hypothetical protein
MKFSLELIPLFDYDNVCLHQGVNGAIVRCGAVVNACEMAASSLPLMSFE